MVREMQSFRRLTVALMLLTAGVCGAAEKSGPPPVPKLKELCLETDIAKDGEPAATIVVPGSGCYDELAARIAAACKELTGAKLSIVKDDDPAAAIPLRGNLITLGNRSTNALIGRLYDRFYTLLDLRYPGGGGHVVRTLHNPFGGGLNVVFAGGSDPAGIEKAVDVLVQQLTDARTEKSIRLGHLAVIRLGDKTQLPKGVKDAQTWEASAGYGSVGYFGWNSISKRMALHYMTGNEFHAREFLRLAFPDEKARGEISATDGERIEDKYHPLSGPYHYNAHMMILFWDLIEESPVFSDEDRLRVTRAFAEQLNHWSAEWAYAARSTAVPGAVGSRHHQWAANSLYCLARYFQKHYPDPVWQRCRESAENHFGSLHDYAWVSGENDNLYWYNTAIAPVLTYMVLTGDRVPLENGVLGRLLRGQEILVSGRKSDWALNSASIGFLHKSAYVTQDGRWLTYRDRTGVDTGVFRLGQSFWPDERLEPKSPEDLVGKWTVHRLSEPKWKARASGLPLEQSFEFGSFRSRPDAGGDFILIDGFNGASRNPYHTFAIIELRLAGYTLLKGYLNQAITRVDGLMEPKIAMNAALLRADVIGSTAVAVAEVPDAPYANWRRTLLGRVGRYGLVIDELTFRGDGENAEVLFEWQTEHAARRLADGQIVFDAVKEQGGRVAAKWGQVCACEPVETVGGSTHWTMKWLGPIKAGQRKTFFSLVGVQPDAEKPTMECHRIAGNAAVLALPEAAMAIVHADGQDKAELAVVAGDHLFAMAATAIEPLVRADRPVDLDWDLKEGVLHVVAGQDTELGLELDPSANTTLDGKPLAAGSQQGATTGRFKLPPGRHVVRRAVPRSEAAAGLRERLKIQLEKGRGARAEMLAARNGTAEPDVPTLEAEVTAKFDSAVVDLEVVPTGDDPLVAAAEGQNIHLLGLDGKETKTLAADGAIRMLRWWPRPGLLLAGCADEKVIAFDRTGQRRWVFVSEMDPALYRAAKTYWFKSEPGHEGIHGLATGVFLDGKSQAFVGSACTLEILDEDGKLTHRMPQFWGKVSTFCVTDGPAGTKNLLAARKYNGTNTVAIINSRSLNPSPRGFHSVPPGHTYMPGWSSMNRHHLFYEDLDGDGVGEVISEINGTWNRVCVWSVEGKAISAASFGPGPRIPVRTMRDLDVCDLDGDGKKEIVAATSCRMVLGLDSRCNKLWATRAGGAVGVLACVRPKGQDRALVVTGCDDGRLRVLDATGNLVQTGTLAGPATCIAGAADAEGNQLVAVGTGDGGVSVFLPDGAKQRRKKTLESGAGK